MTLYPGDRDSARGQAIVDGHRAYGDGQPRDACPLDDDELADKWRWGWDLASRVHAGRLAATRPATSFADRSQGE